MVTYRSTQKPSTISYGQPATTKATPSSSSQHASRTPTASHNCLLRTTQPTLRTSHEVSTATHTMNAQSANTSSQQKEPYTFVSDGALRHLPSSTQKHATTPSVHTMQFSHASVTCPPPNQHPATPPGHIVSHVMVLARPQIRTTRGARHKHRMKQCSAHLHSTCPVPHLQPTCTRQKLHDMATRPVRKDMT